MNPEHLEFDEFELECLIRDVKVPNPKERLDCLKERLKLEELHPVLIPNRPHRPAQKNPRREIHKLSLKISFLYSDLQESIKDGNNENLIKLHSRLIHVQGRLIRLKYSKTVRDQVTETLDKVTQLINFVVISADKEAVELNESLHDLEQINLNKVEEQIETDNPLNSDNSSDSDYIETSIRSATDRKNPNMASSSTARPLEHNIPVISKANQWDDDKPNTIPGRGSIDPDKFPPLLSSPRPRQVNNRSHRSLSKWDIVYNGHPKGIHIKRFLTRVEHMARSEEVPPQKLVTDLHYILKGNANDWYWTFIERNPNITWDMLKMELKKCFQGPRTDEDIRSQLETRKQKYRESFTEYYHDIISMTLQLELPLTEQEIIRMIRRNMRAGLQDKLTDSNITSVDELFRKCVAYEDTWARTGFLPELMCQQHKSIHSLESAEQEFNRMSMSDFMPTYPPMVAQNASEVSQSTNIAALANNRELRPPKPFYSPNPHQTPGLIHVNHLSRQPIDNRRPDGSIFCAGCGTKGYRMEHCFKCNPPSGNWRAGARNANISDPQRNNQVETASNTDPELIRRTQ